MLWGVSDGVMKALDDSKVIATIGRDNVFAVQPEIGASTGAALEAADAWIDAHRSTVTPDRDAPSESTTRFAPLVVGVLLWRSLGSAFGKKLHGTIQADRLHRVCGAQ